MAGVMFEDTSEDVGRTYDDDEPAGDVKATWPELPSERHRQVLSLLLANSRRDRAGRLVSWWPQGQLAAKLHCSTRTLQRVVADLREPGSDPRHPNVPAAGLRLGLVKVEPTSYQDAATGRHRLGGNVYVLLPWPGESDTPAKPVSAGHVNTTEGAVSLVNKEPPPASEERWVSNPLVSGGPRDPLDVGRQRELERLEYDPTRAEVLATLQAGLGPVEVLGEWPNDQPSGHPTYSTARGRRLDLAGPLADFQAAVDQLDRDMCMNGGCQPGHPCRRHARRNRARG